MTERKIPLIPTIIVVAAMLTMIALGIWQLSRRSEKLAAIDQYEHNLNQPAISFPKLPPVEDDALFRPSSVTCLKVEGWKEEAGRRINGTMGYKYIAECSTGAEGPGVLIAIGVGGKPDLKPDWQGGTVQGRIALARDETSLLAKMFGHNTPPSPILISNEGLAGLDAAAQPSPDSVPNNHLAYAVQWFFFALVAGVIYMLALRRKWNS